MLLSSAPCPLPAFPTLRVSCFAFSRPRPHLRTSQEAVGCLPENKPRASPDSTRPHHTSSTNTIFLPVHIHHHPQHLFAPPVFFPFLPPPAQASSPPPPAASALPPARAPPASQSASFVLLPPALAALVRPRQHSQPTPPTHSHSHTPRYAHLLASASACRPTPRIWSTPPSRSGHHNSNNNTKSIATSQVSTAHACVTRPEPPARTRIPVAGLERGYRE